MNYSVNDYQPNMDVLDSRIKDQIIDRYEDLKDKKVTKADVLASLEKDQLNEEDYFNLLSDAGLDLLDQMGALAKKRRGQYFGNNVCLFSPIYIANYCNNSCRYCGFRSKSPIQRAKLTEEEIELEMKSLSESGIEDVLILTGESQEFSSIDYITSSVEIAKKYFTSIGLEVYPANVEDYKKLHKAGADYVTVFQESYNKEAYDFYHPFGHKRSWVYRVETQERALMAGMRGVGFGALFGLADPVEDAFKLAYHASLIQKKYPHGEIAISLPRIRPTQGADNTLNFNYVSDKKFFQILLAIRIYLPFASITLSTRESKDFRDLAVQYGATKISASVDTSIGHRSKETKDSGDEQFAINDTRTTEDAVKDLLNLGMTPVYTDYLRL